MKIKHQGHPCESYLSKTLEVSDIKCTLASELKLKVKLGIYLHVRIRCLL